MPRVLIVEDESNLAVMIRDWLIADQHEVDVANTGAEARQHFSAHEYDVIVLDRHLPDAEGADICREFRSKGGMTPIIMLTGKKLIDEKEEGFDAGADDYLTKPFQLKELSIRVSALMRRPRELLEQTIKVGDLVLNSQAHSLLKSGLQIALLPKDFLLLEFLMRHPNQVFSPEELLSRLWSSDQDVTIEAVRQSIKRIRSKIDPEGKSSIIDSIQRLGYRLNAD